MKMPYSISPPPQTNQDGGSSSKSGDEARPPRSDLRKQRPLHRQPPRNPLQPRRHDQWPLSDDENTQESESEPKTEAQAEPEPEPAAIRAADNASRNDLARESTDHLSPMIPLSALPSRSSSISMASGQASSMLPSLLASRLNMPGVSAAKQKAIEDARKKQARVVTEAARENVEPPPYVLEELIGKGSYGRVYRARALQGSAGAGNNHKAPQSPTNGDKASIRNIASRIKNLRLNNFPVSHHEPPAKEEQSVAIKIIDIEASDRANPDAHTNDSFEEFRKEVEALRRLESEGARNINHIIECLGVGRTVWMVTQYCAGGSVSTLMKPNKPRGLDEKWIVPLLREVAEALSWVHKVGIVHRDIKCANVLVDENGGVQLADFGVATFYGENKDGATAGVSVVGTPHWMAPELLDSAPGHHKHGAEVDIWSFGAMAYEMATGLPPYAMEESSSDPAALAHALHTRPPRLQGSQYSEDLKSIIEYCLQIDPHQRPSIDVIKQHPYIAGTDMSHPVESLTALVKTFKTWEARGGSRDSLFMGPGHARRGSKCSLASRGSKGSLNTDNEDSSWDFSSQSFGSDFFDNAMNKEQQEDEVKECENTGISTEKQTTEVAENGGSDSDTPRQTTSSTQKTSRFQFNEIRVKRPLERLFDNTTTSYSEASRMYYLKLFRTGGPPNILSPPPPPLPMPQSSLSAYKDSSARSSLIDLDLSTDISIDPAQRSSFVQLPSLSPLSSSSASSMNMDPLTSPLRSHHGAHNAPEIVIDPATLPSVDVDLKPDVTLNLEEHSASGFYVPSSDAALRRPTQDWRFPSSALITDPEPPVARPHPIKEHYNENEPLSMLGLEMREPEYDQHVSISGDMDLALPFSDGVALQDAGGLKDDYFSFAGPERSSAPAAESPGSLLSVSPKTTHGSLFRADTDTSVQSTATTTVSSRNTSWYYDTPRLSETSQDILDEMPERGPEFYRASESSASGWRGSRRRESRVDLLHQHLPQPVSPIDTTQPLVSVNWVRDSASFLNPRPPPVPAPTVSSEPGPAPPPLPPQHSSSRAKGSPAAHGAFAAGHAATHSEPNVPQYRRRESVYHGDHGPAARAGQGEAGRGERPQTADSPRRPSTNAELLSSARWPGSREKGG